MDDNPSRRVETTEGSSLDPPALEQVSTGSRLEPFLLSTLPLNVSGNGRRSGIPDCGNERLDPGGAAKPAPQARKAVRGDAAPGGSIVKELSLLAGILPPMG